jgi:hypothetical protein
MVVTRTLMEILTHFFRELLLNVMTYCCIHQHYYAAQLLAWQLCVCNWTESSLLIVPLYSEFLRMLIIKQVCYCLYILNFCVCRLVAISVLIMLVEAQIFRFLALVRLIMRKNLDWYWVCCNRSCFRRCQFVATSMLLFFPAIFNSKN